MSGRAAAVASARELGQSAAESALPWPRRAFAIAAVLSAMAMVVLDAGITNLALPTMAASLHIAPATAVLVVTVYQTALIMALLPCGALGERFGHARVFAWGAAIFTAASGLAAVSTSLPMLLAARFAQGLGGAAILALGVALLRLSVSHRQLGAAIGWNALTVALSTAASPLIGALLLAQWSWRWIYALDLPLGLCVLLAAHALPRADSVGARLDRMSMLLNAGMFGGLILSAELILSAPAIAALLFCASAGVAIALVARERSKAAPIIPIDLLRIRSFRIAVLASVCCFTGQTMALVALPFLLQHGLGQSAPAAALYMTPWPLTVAATALLTGRLVHRYETWILCVAGAACLTLGIAGAAFWPFRDEPHFLIVCTMLCGLGFGLFQIPNNRAMFMAAPLARSGAAGGLQGVARLSGQTSGAVVMGLLLASLSLDAAPPIGLALGAACTLLAALVSALQRRPREA